MPRAISWSWSGYKLPIDVADGAIPLATLTAGRVGNLYDPGSGPGQALMDSAYDAPEIRAHSHALGHVPIIDVNPRSRARKQALQQETRARRTCGLVLSEERRYHERSSVERVNGRLKSLPPA